MSAAAGWPLTNLKWSTGNASIETTMIYAHAVPRHDDAARSTEAFKQPSTVSWGVSRTSAYRA